MIPRISKVEPKENFILFVQFDDGKKVNCDVKENINDIPSYQSLKTIHGLFNQVMLDESRTCIYWNDEIDLPSDTIYEYGQEV